MRIYLDICCIKRPWDDQTQPRIAAETAAVLSVLQGVRPGTAFVRSLAHDLENSVNPDPRRAKAVADWLATLAAPGPTPDAVEAAFRRYTASGLGPMDAYHLAWAAHLRADVLITTDDRFCSRAARVVDPTALRVTDPLTFVRECQP